MRVVQIVAFGEIVRIRGVRWRDHRLVGRFDRAGEDAVQRVVVGGRNRIELVIVAARAGDRQPEERLRRDIDPIVDDVAASCR